jgi:peptidoglycan hydrolase-like protein with peptidoglycan-binding domain
MQPGQTTGQRQQGQQTQQQQNQQTQSNQSAQTQQSGGRVELNAQQRTQLQQTVLARSDLPRLNRVDFRLNVGILVPARVRVIPVTQELIAIRPDFRDHLFFVVRDEIVILDNSRHIVAVMPVGPSSAQIGVRAGGRRDGALLQLSSAEIRQVQEVLVQQGFSVEVDGRLGPRTRQALIQFQRRQGLAVTGQIDSRTVTALGVNIQSMPQGQPGTTTGQGRGAQQPSGQNQPSGSGGMNPSGRNQPSGQDHQPTGQTGQPRAGQNAPATTGQGGSNAPSGGASKNAPANQSSNPPANPPASNAPASQTAPSGTKQQQ